MFCFAKHSLREIFAAASLPPAAKAITQWRKILSGVWRVCKTCITAIFSPSFWGGGGGSGSLPRYLRHRTWRENQMLSRCLVGSWLFLPHWRPQQESICILERSRTERRAWELVVKLEKWLTPVAVVHDDSLWILQSPWLEDSPVSDSPTSPQATENVSVTERGLKFVLCPTERKGESRQTFYQGIVSWLQMEMQSVWNRLQHILCFDLKWLHIDLIVI